MRSLNILGLLLFMTLQIVLANQYQDYDEIRTYALGGMETNCEFVSGSVTGKFFSRTFWIDACSLIITLIMFIVVNCPQSNRLYVFLSEMLVNTTLSNIENEINGEPDYLELRYDEPDYIRFIIMENVNVTLVKKSK